MTTNDIPPRSPAEPDWAGAFGRDGFGAWADLCVVAARQRFRWIPAGRFVMGAGACEAAYDEPDWFETPRHPVTISRGFWLADTPVTQGLWDAVHVAAGTPAENPSEFRSPDRPVDHVSHRLADAFVATLDRLTARPGWALPTEAEWEYAARAGTDGMTWRGDHPILGKDNAPALDPIAWYGGNCGVEFDLPNGHLMRPRPTQYAFDYGGTHPVARKEPNPWGLYDMLGNVWECCDDPPRAYGRDHAIDPRGTTGSRRIIRGGSWVDFAKTLRAATRHDADPHRGNVTNGFRLLWR